MSDIKDILIARAAFIVINSMIKLKLKSLRFLDS